jgi:hypothetical protein
MLANLRLHALLCSAAAALFSGGTLQAELISTVNGSGQFTPFLASQPFGCSNAGTTTASCSVTPVGDVSHSASGSYRANAQYGSLDAISMSSVFGGSLGGTSAARFSDTLLLTGGIGSGTLVFVTEYSGMAPVSCETGACLLNSTVALNTFTVHPSSGPVIANLSFSFSFGTLFNLNASVSAYSSALGNETVTQTAHLKINSIRVLDSTGALITDYALTAGSGAAYVFATPEPGSFALVITALFALPIVSRRRISASQKS